MSERDIVRAALVRLVCANGWRTVYIGSRMERCEITVEDGSKWLDEAAAEIADEIERLRAREDGEAGEPVALTHEILAELGRARAKFPGDNVTTLALVEEVGELAKATFEESRERVRQEAIQVAAMAMRVVLDGDSTLNWWRESKGLDRLPRDLAPEDFDEAGRAMLGGLDRDPHAAPVPVQDEGEREIGEHVLTERWFILGDGRYDRQVTLNGDILHEETVDAMPDLHRRLVPVQPQEPSEEES